MVLYGLVEILKLKSKPLMNGRGYGVRSGRVYGVMAFKSEQSVSQSVSYQGRYRAAKAAKNVKFWS